MTIAFVIFSRLPVHQDPLQATEGAPRVLVIDQMHWASYICETADNKTAEVVMMWLGNFVNQPVIC